MTTVASMMFEDHIMFACDSQENDGTYTYPQKKLQELKPFPLVCALSGDTSVIDVFWRWIHEHCAKEKNLTWKVLRQDITDKLIEFNGVKRDTMNRSGVKVSPEDLASVLAAGYLNGEPSIFEVNCMGGVFIHDERRVAAIGTGVSSFHLVKRTIQNWHKQHNEPGDYDDPFFGFNDLFFEFCFDRAASNDPFTGKRLEFARITSDGVTYPKRQLKDFER